MSRHSSYDRTVTITENNEVLEVIREEQSSPTMSSVNIQTPAEEEDKDNPCTNCSCKPPEEPKPQIDPQKIEEMLHERENELRAEFQHHLEKEINILKDRFDFILQNEQVRASYMLREAHRERKEKVMALQTQLECKNLAGLMYVLCSERRKSKLEKLKLIEDYTQYITTLQEILADAQSLILNLSRGYKTAARVDHEWREKMKVVVQEFLAFVYHYAGGTPESNQYFFNIPELLKTKAPIVDNPNEDPCDNEHEEPVFEESEENKNWWERLEGDCRPFVMFGDMAEFKPPQRREVLRTVKAAKTAPEKWKEYVFNEMHLRAGCPNAEVIKDEYFKHIPYPAKWECSDVQTHDQGFKSTSDAAMSRRATTTSIDIRGNMGSILKIITSTAAGQPAAKATLLGARDSMEIASTTKLREKHKKSEQSRVTINVGSRRTSLFENFIDDDFDEPEAEELDIPENEPRDDAEDADDVEDIPIPVSVTHHDSLEVIPSHVPDQDHKINYEKVCPVEKCNLMQVDSFVRSLPPYMRASPFTYFEQTYEEYETCTPEQLEILKQRIEEKKKDKSDHVVDEPLAEWSASVEGVGVQTSNLSMSLPPCTCQVPSPTPVSSNGMVFNMDDLIPVKLALDKINQECFYDGRIQFDRFKVIGQESEDSMMKEGKKKDFALNKLHEIRKILKKHPSLCEIFQANIRC